MLEEIKNIRSQKNDLRIFGIIIGIALMIIGTIFFFKNKESFQILLIFGAALCLLSVIIPIYLKPLYWLWMILGMILGWIMTRVILSFLFYVIMTPIGIIGRLVGNQFIELRWEKSQSSYWNQRKDKPQKIENYENQF